VVGVGGEETTGMRGGKSRVFAEGGSRTSKKRAVPEEGGGCVSSFKKKS